MSLDKVSPNKLLEKYYPKSGRRMKPFGANRKIKSNNKHQVSLTKKLRPEPNDFLVVGMNHYGNYKISHNDKLSFEFEPTNEHDPKAIKVLANGIHVGYIMRRQCGLLEHLVNTSQEYNVSLVEHYKNSCRIWIS